MAAQAYKKGDQFRYIANKPKLEIFLKSIGLDKKTVWTVVEDAGEQVVLGVNDINGRKFYFDTKDVRRYKDGITWYPVEPDEDEVAVCCCNITILMYQGCQCGHIQKERSANVI